MSPSATASPCVFADDTYYCSAKGPFTPGPGRLQGIWVGTVEAQVRQTMRNLLDGLEEAGLTLSNVVATNVYLDDINDFARMNRIYARTFPTLRPPARPWRSSRRWSARRGTRTRFRTRTDFVDCGEVGAAMSDDFDNLYGGVTRRELFQIGNVLALPVLGRRESPGGGGSARAAEGRAADLSVDRRGAGHQLPRHVHHHRRIGGAARSAGGDGRRRPAQRADWTSWRMRSGRRLAELTGAEWGMVSAGCAAGLKHVTAACVAGGNPEKLLRIPDLTGFDKTEVVIPRSLAQRLRPRHPQYRREDRSRWTRPKNWRTR